MRLAPTLALLTLALAPLPAAADPLVVPRARAPIRFDGRLDDVGWQGAARIDTFYEFSPGDNVPPKVRTVAYLTYDDRYFYVGVLCQDPDPRRIRAPFVERDNVLGDQDNVAVQLDTRNDGRTALELRANARGIQADAFINDASANDSEDFSPDYFYDTAARITRTGWTVEFRIPFSTLRYSAAREQVWGILIWRNYPREFRQQIGSSRIPRGSPCFQCHEMKLLLRDVPAGRHIVAAPYVTANENGAPVAGGPGFADGPVRGDGGLDLKATLNADAVFDATLNPDFSQVESDVGQLTVNNRFAPLYPEKRPFFLEQIDLLQTPLQAVHSRSITSPAWGARFTGGPGATSYTMLFTEDRGGGSVIVPGPSESSFAPQDFGSLVAIGRVRHDFGLSYAGLLVTDRQMGGGAHNLVVGPDFEWWGPVNQLAGQFLVSDTRELNRPDLSPTWNGEALHSHAAYVNWGHSTRTVDWGLAYTDIGEGFRADAGFMPQVGYRSATLDLGYKFYPTGVLTAVRPAIGATYTVEPGGALIARSQYPYLGLQGRWALNARIEYHPHEPTRVLGDLFVTDYTKFSLQMRPSALVPNLTVSGHVGGDVDVVNLRPGSGGDVTGSISLRPTSHIDFTFNGERQWLDVAPAGVAAGRLFTAQIGRLKVTYILTARSFVRAIGQYETITRDSSLYLVPALAREGRFSGSALYAYKLNWQTVLFAGYADDRALNETNHLALLGRNFFLKVSYAFQR